VTPLDCSYQFWRRDNGDLIRRRVLPDGTSEWPEVWSGSGWHSADMRAWSAITGIGDDPYSCGEWAEDLSEDQARAHARSWAIDLYAPSEGDQSESHANV
jgi:hypothetical protein